MKAPLLAGILSFATLSACGKPDNAAPAAAPSTLAAGSAAASPGAAGTAAGCDITVDATKGEVKVEEGKRYCFANATFTSETTPPDVEKLSALGSCKREDLIGATNMTCGKLRLQFAGPKPWLKVLQVQ